MKLEDHGWAADFPEGADCNTDLSEGSLVTNPDSHGMSHRQMPDLSSMPSTCLIPAWKSISLYLDEGDWS